MGVEYKHYVIASPNHFRPTVGVVIKLIETLRQHRWILTPNSPELRVLPFSTMTYYAFARDVGIYAQTANGYVTITQANFEHFLYMQEETDFLLGWPIENFGQSNLRYPLSPEPFNGPEEADGCYYELQLHFGKDFIYHMSEVVEPFDSPLICACGRKMEYCTNDEIFLDSRITRICPVCGYAFDVTDRVCRGRDGWTGQPFSILGGTAYRFALVVDCGKCFGTRPLQLNSDLRRLIESTLGTNIYEVPDFY